MNYSTALKVQTKLEACGHGCNIKSSVPRKQTRQQSEIYILHQTRVAFDMLYGGISHLDSV